MTPDSGILHLIIEYRYLILVPLSFVEGPIVAFFAGTLASLGYFNIYVLGIFFLVRDILVDLGCYFLGRYLGKKEFVHRFLHRIHINEEDIENTRKLWHVHPGKTMFFSKLSYGVAAGFIIVAGMVEMPLKRFLFWGFCVAVMHYGVLLVIGYFFGVSLGGSIEKIFTNVQYGILGLVILGTAYYFFKRYMGRRLRKEEDEASTQV
jgi:membrane protein DedA with SNARE-associated domain